MEITAEFFITHKPETLSKIETVTITGDASTPKGKTFRFEDQYAKVKGEYIITNTMLANRHLAARKTQFFNPMTIEWQVKYKKNGIPKTKVLGTTDHKVYVTLKKPLRKFAKLFLTPLHLATSNPGAMGTLGEAKKQALEKTWQLFETKKITTWDKKPLYYYKQGSFQSLYCATENFQAKTEFLGQFLTSTEGGQCNAFEKLFIAALGANGIDSQTVEAYTKNNDRILVKNWKFPNEPSLTGTGDYQFRLILNDEGTEDGIPYFGTYPLNDDYTYGELISEPGIAGQNSLPPLFAPAEKVCGNHYLVKVTDEDVLNQGLQTFYYDPSYGVTYPGEKEEAERHFEKDAVSGYYNQFLEKEKEKDQKPNYFRARKQTFGEVNIQFDN